MRKSISISLFGLLIAFLAFPSSGQVRQTVDLCASWNFNGTNVAGDSIREVVNLPHTWNSHDAEAGFEYYRGAGRYTKKLDIGKNLSGKRLFLKFEGVHTVADVYLNGKHLGQHRGGYAAFVFEITGEARIGEMNLLEVKVDNSRQEDILPLGGDFNQYGGIYRPVHLIVTDPVCISPLDFASPGIYIRQLEITPKEANIEVLTRLSNGGSTDQNLQVVTTVLDRSGNQVAGRDTEFPVKAGNGNDAVQKMTIPEPKLWQGKSSPYLYQVRVQVVRGKVILDEVIQPLGLRKFSVEADKGFFLNGYHVPLHGVSRHQDKAGKGSALTEEDHRTDMKIMNEMGVNALRLAHYQQSGYFYSLCDTAGMVVWAEIPFVGSMIGGFNDTPAFRENGKQQLKELIRQNFNHPSICFWGIYNELSNPSKNSPTAYVKELFSLAREEDPARLVTAASLLPDGDELHFITDVVAWNKYFGWYNGRPEDLGKWADKLHGKYPKLCIAISEYGAGGSVRQHEENPKRPFPMFHPWHPEEWQAQVHEKLWKIISERPFIWGTFVWNMFDFGVDFRNEGDTPALNDKGLVTWDRKTRKDAFYLYKVNWNEEPMVHITDKNYVIREKGTADIKVYSNLKEVELFVNDKSAGIRPTVDKIVRWEDVRLSKGNNRIRANGHVKGKEVKDQCVWVYRSIGWIDFVVWFFRYGIVPLCLLLVVIIPLLYVRAFKRENKKAMKILYVSLFSILVLLAILILAAWLLGTRFYFNIFDYSVI